MLGVGCCTRKLRSAPRLGDALIELTDHDSLSRETLRRRLAENGLKPWRRNMWCIPKVDAAYVAAMEDVLDLYASEPDPDQPVIGFDESATQLIGEVHQPIPARPGQHQRYDREYRRMARPIYWYSVIFISHDKPLVHLRAGGITSVNQIVRPETPANSSPPHP